MDKVLAVNSGSSSLKFKLFEMPSEAVIASGLIERIAIPDLKRRLSTETAKSINIREPSKIMEKRSIT